MLTLAQIRAAHAKVRSGADFPRYIQDLKDLGLAGYDCYVTDGSLRYQAQNGEELEAPGRYDILPITVEGNAAALEKALRVHQAGDTNYPTFCREAADAGVEKWTVDMSRMTCSYYDQSGTLLVEEAIPSPQS